METDLIIKEYNDAIDNARIDELIEEKKQRKEIIRKRNYEIRKAMEKSHPFKIISKRYQRLNPKITSREIWKMVKKQKARCALSGRRLKGECMSVDHIIPKSKGGSHELENLRIVIKSINTAKWDVADNDFIQMCKDVAVFNTLN